MKIDKVVIDVNKTLGNLTFLRCEEKKVYTNGVEVAGQFEYIITLLSDALKGEIKINKFFKKLEFSFGQPVELVGEVLVESKIVGQAPFNKVDHSLKIEDIRLKGQVQSNKQDQK